nr:Chain A, Nuclear localization sequence of NIT2 transcription factor (NIT2-NLS) [Neurospora crassa]5VQI_C Chain C, Nuclear localization sequence of NIT2 transcription factor (NIT2-NLS) [Neurospora crassa]6P6A_A Chain A, Nitrogen catabolic enzyme regulatory protein [Neurospora crassa OR74A]6P6A_C Chain C, Nitrogen catabolic enzyme regulatory protein [Neurospora crassa OR74A]
TISSKRQRRHSKS